MLWGEKNQEVPSDHQAIFYIDIFNYQRLFSHESMFEQSLLLVTFSGTGKCSDHRKLEAIQGPRKMRKQAIRKLRKVRRKQRMVRRVGRPREIFE